MPAVMLELAVKSLLSYLLGAVLGGLIVGRLRGGVDIRTMGSGNAGGTNALRTQGAGFAVWVMLIDIGKGWIAAGVLPYISLPGVAIDTAIARDWLAVACATAAVLGHVYPVWYGFRGGKGAATLVGVLIGLEPMALPVVLGVWLIVLMTTGFVGLSTMLATLSFIAYLFFSGLHSSAALLTFAIGMFVFVCYTHRANIERMRAGTENRATRMWLLRPRSR